MKTVTLSVGDTIILVDDNGTLAQVQVGEISKSAQSYVCRLEVDVRGGLKILRTKSPTAPKMQLKTASPKKRRK